MKIIFASLIGLTTASSLVATPVDFVRDVQPIFQKHCSECHGEKKQKSGLRLDVKALALQGGEEHGPNILPGKAKDSSLIRLITSKDEDDIMPPQGKDKGGRMKEEEIAILIRWIEEGAIWPDGVDLVKLVDRRDHWSFKPVAVAQGDHSIDAFIAAKLKEKGLSLSPEADQATWLRRVTFDLTGLPPSPEQLTSFLQASTVNTQTAREYVVNALLNSPRYGEHWAQHWLDVVRYADTHGFEVNTERPNAWPYRDYVIDAFNHDTPYDHFIREQIAGDAMGKDAATGFLVTASVLLPGQIGKDEPSKRLARQDSIDEIVSNVGQTFLGLSVGCARCHDHKFDPITAQDYYSMQAFFAGVQYGDRELNTPAAEAARKELMNLRSRQEEIDKQLVRFVPLAKAGAERPSINARENVDRFAPVKAKRLRFTFHATNKLEACIDELEVFDNAGRNIALASAGTVPGSSGNIIVADRHDLKHINDGLYGNSRSWMSDVKAGGWVTLEFPEEQIIERVVWGRDREGKFTDRLATSYVIEVAETTGEWRTIADSSDRRKFDENNKKPVAFSTKGLSKNEAKQASDLMRERSALDAKIGIVDNAHRAFAGTFRDPDKIHLLNRGDPEQPKAEVVPAVLSAFGALKLPAESREQERRKALADWIASPDNPLTARVMVNRIWQGHFGTGLVETASDFGRNGTKPSHPELLDWLASEFIRTGWSIKQMHKLIVLSATYRQSSSTFQSRNSGPSGNDLDADDRLLWRFPSRRIEAESIRDSMLAVSGRLNLKMYGRGFDLFDKRGGLSGFTPVESFTGDGLRRMIYAHKVRREREAVFGAFDCPDAGQSTARRRESTTPIQALNLFNSRFTIDESEALASRVKASAGNDIAKQIRLTYQLALSRDPSAEELHDIEPAVREHGLATLCRALFNSNEFLFLP
ncbi:MAG: hypothetical protein RL693_848 [Verrucomicrobiota bacterium]|jgi:mono/diheme cytochrome c family protein